MMVERSAGLCSAEQKENEQHKGEEERVCMHAFEEECTANEDNQGRNAWKRIIFVKMFQWTMTSSYCCSQDCHKMLRLEKTNTSAALQLT